MGLLRGHVVRLTFCLPNCSYLSSVLPPGNENLKGDEVEKIIAFKDALGLEDADAAPVHIEVGLLFYRRFVVHNLVRKSLVVQFLCKRQTSELCTSHVSELPADSLQGAAGYAQLTC